MSEGVLVEATAPAIEALRELEAVLSRISDADLHRAHPDGGWTCAQVVSHIQISGMLWIAALERLRHQPSLFIYREELGHDAVYVDGERQEKPVSPWSRPPVIVDVE